MKLEGQTEIQRVIEAGVTNGLGWDIISHGDDESVVSELEHLGRLDLRINPNDQEAKVLLDGITWGRESFGLGVIPPMVPRSLRTARKFMWLFAGKKRILDERMRRVMEEEHKRGYREGRNEGWLNGFGAGLRILITQNTQSEPQGSDRIRIEWPQKILLQFPFFQRELFEKIN